MSSDNADENASAMRDLGQAFMLSARFQLRSFDTFEPIFRPWEVTPRQAMEELREQDPHAHACLSEWLVLDDDLTAS